MLIQKGLGSSCQKNAFVAVALSEAFETREEFEIVQRDIGHLKQVPCPCEVHLECHLTTCTVGGLSICYLPNQVCLSSEMMCECF